MAEFFNNILIIFFIVFFFGFSIFFHELGHLLAALWRKLHIEKFSIGFGPSIFKFKIKNIECSLGCLPFGGYVALPQMAPMEEASSKEGKKLSPISSIDKIIVAIAGPLFNIIFAFFLATILWNTGVLESKPIDKLEVSHVPKNSVEKKAGIKEGDVIQEINGKKFHSYEDFLEKMAFEGEITLTVLRNGKIVKLGPYRQKIFEELRSMPLPTMSFVFPAIIGVVKKDSAEDKANLQLGDKIIKVNNIEVEDAINCNYLINESKGNPLEITYQRDDKTYTTTLTPDKRSIIGFRSQNPHKAVIQEFSPYSPAFYSNLMINDVITKINNKKISSMKDLHQIMQEHPTKISLEIYRPANNYTVSLPIEKLKKLQYTITKDKISLAKDYRKTIAKNDIIYKINDKKITSLEDLNFPSDTKEVVIEVTRQKQTLNIDIIPSTVYNLSFTNLATVYKKPWDRISNLLTRSYKSVYAMINPKSDVSTKQLTSVVGISDSMFTLIKNYGYTVGISFIILINVSLAFMNLLPLPALDGGHILIATIEGISRRKIPVIYLQKITVVFAILLIILIIYVTKNDILSIMQ